MSTARALRNWRPGTPITADRLQEKTEAIRELQTRTRKIERRTAPNVDDSQPASEVWTFVTKTVATERIEDATDSSIYIDVERTTSVTVRKPDGNTVLIEFE